MQAALYELYKLPIDAALGCLAYGMHQAAAFSRWFLDADGSNGDSNAGRRQRTNPPNHASQFIAR